MNYLAHIFLSGEDRLVQLGNFMGDAVKGSAYNDYPCRIRKGILLHRAIDEFTDSHPAVREAVREMRPHFGRYSAALLDIYFDYLLASRFGDFSTTPLDRFSRRFYHTMIQRRRVLPSRIRRFMWHFIFTDRLGRYATVEGIGESLGIMAATGRLQVSPGDATDYLKQNEERLRMVFVPFFAELSAMCQDFLRR